MIDSGEVYLILNILRKITSDGNSKKRCKINNHRNIKFNLFYVLVEWKIQKGRWIQSSIYEYVSYIVLKTDTQLMLLGPRFMPTLWGRILP